MTHDADGIIELDSERGKPFGLTSDNFAAGTYYWRVDDSVYVSFVHSKTPGAFRHSIEAILAAGLTVKIPTPLGRMQEIVLKNGYQHTTEKFLDEDCDVWVKTP